ADALETGDEALALHAIDSFRELRDRQVELARLRGASVRVARHSAVWRAQRAPLVHENENAAHLDLLSGSCLMLARRSLEVRQSDRAALAEIVRDIAETVADLSPQLGDRAVRQAAADRVLAIARAMDDMEAEPGSNLGEAVSAAR